MRLPMLLFAAWLALLLAWGVVSSGCAVKRPAVYIFRDCGVYDAPRDLWICSGRLPS